MSDIIDETPVVAQEESITTETSTPTTIDTPLPDLLNKSLWAHETPGLNTTDAVMTDLQDDTEVINFDFSQISTKIREAEQYYDKCNYDASTAILVKCMQLYDDKYGKGWFHIELDKDIPLINLPNITQLLEFARLVKEYALNMILLAKINDSLSDKGQSAATGQDGEGELPTEEGGQQEEEEEVQDSNGFDDDSDDGDDDDEDDEKENKETYFNYATENLQLAYAILSRYIIERSHPPTGNDSTDPEKQIFSERVIKDQNGADTTVRYALGNPSQREIPASDLLPSLWRKEGITILHVEICQIYLGDVYDSLADVHIEEEQWADAANYLELSLRLRKRTEKAWGRGLASIHTKYASYYSLRHQYEFSNQHFLLAASVFGHRTLDKVDWLYKNLSLYKLDEKCPREKFIGTMTKAISASDDDLLMKQSDIAILRKFVNEELIPTITNRIFGGGEITEPNVKDALANITDYFLIIDSIMDLHADNLLDIQEGKEQSAIEGNDGDSNEKIDETQRVKKMVEEVWRTDSILDSMADPTDFNTGLGFKTINKTGTLEGTLANAAAAATSTTANAAAAIPAAPLTGPAFAPTVKRKARGPAPGEDDQQKRQRTNDTTAQ